MSVPSGDVPQLATLEIGQRAGFVNRRRVDFEKLSQNPASCGGPCRLLPRNRAIDRNWVIHLEGSLAGWRTFIRAINTEVSHFDFLAEERARRSTKMRQRAAGFIGLKANPHGRRLVRCRVHRVAPRKS